MDKLGELVAMAIPFIIPVFLLGSWLVNHKTSSGGGDAKTSPKVSDTTKPAEKKVSDKDMTGT